MGVAAPAAHHGHHRCSRVGKSTLVAAALDAFAPPPLEVLSGTARVHTPRPVTTGWPPC
jgi:hypothetical protein